MRCLGRDRPSVTPPPLEAPPRASLGVLQRWLRAERNSARTETAIASSSLRAAAKQEHRSRENEPPARSTWQRVLMKRQPPTQLPESAPGTRRFGRGEMSCRGKYRGQLAKSGGAGGFAAKADHHC